MRRIPRFSQRSALGLLRRLSAMWRRRALNRFVRAKRVRLVRLGGRRFKRITLPDASVAAAIARSLDTFRHAGVVPALVAAVDAELLVEYVDGDPLPLPIPPAHFDRLAGFFAVLYAADPRRVCTADTRFGDELQRDLGFLRDVGVLGVEAHRDLAAAADALAPPEVWVGWDYLDPLPRNFVVARDGRLVAVDVEELGGDRLLGGGVAKACLRSVGGERDRFLAACQRAIAIDLAPVLPFAELHFLAGWTKLAYLKGRAALVDAAHFEPYRAKGSTRSARPSATR